jgi:ABC-type multidrug transport system ATPase subunit
MTTRVLECSDLCAVPGACGLDLTVSAGEFVALREVPDCHESPLLTVAATLRRPVRGSLSLCGRSADFRRQHHLLALRLSLGYVGPGSALVSDLTLAGNLLLGHRYHGSEEAASERIQALVEMMLLEPLLEVKPALLPFQIRRVAVYVRELAKQPRLMVLDHPGLGLSEQAARLVCRALAEEKERGMACLLSAEQPFLALADRVLVLEEGQPATELTVHEAGGMAKVS